MKHRIAITAVSELCCTGSGSLTIKPPAVVLYYSDGNKQEAGVSFMVSSQAAKSVISFHPVSEHLAALTVDGAIKTHIYLCPN